MSFWNKWFGPRKPEHNEAIYIDRGKNGLHYARLVLADDQRMLNGKPETMFMRPVKQGFEHPASAAGDVRCALRRLGRDPDEVASTPVYVEQEDGEVKQL